MKICRFPTLGLFALAAWSCPAASALDFTLHRGQMSADGASVDSTYLLDGDSKIFLRIPRAWQVSDSPGGLDLIPNVSDCHVKIENVPGVQALPLDEAGKVALRKQIDGSVPGGAKNTTALPDADNSLAIYGWKNDFFGQTICQSMMFINMRPGRVVRVTVSAPKADYEAIDNAARVLMFSWFEPSKDLSKETARKLEEGTLGGS